MNAEEERDALVQLIDGRIPDDIPGYRQRYTDLAADAILAAGFRRPGPITDSQVEAAVIARDHFRSDTSLSALDNRTAETRAALEAARDAS